MIEKSVKKLIIKINFNYNVVDLLTFLASRTDRQTKYHKVEPRVHNGNNALIFNKSRENKNKATFTNYCLDRIPRDKHLNLVQKYTGWRRVHNKTI